MFTNGTYILVYPQTPLTQEGVSGEWVLMSGGIHQQVVGSKVIEEAKVNPMCSIGSFYVLIF